MNSPKEFDCKMSLQNKQKLSKEKFQIFLVIIRIYIFDQFKQNKNFNTEVIQI